MVTTTTHIKRILFCNNFYVDHLNVPTRGLLDYATETTRIILQQNSSPILMETEGKFLFSAQSRQESMSEVPESVIRGSANSKRPRSDAKVEDQGRPNTASFKSTLLNMANPKCWEGLGYGKERLRIEQGVIKYYEDSKGRTGADNQLHKGRKCGSSVLGNNSRNTSKGGHGLRKDNGSFRYNTQSNETNSKAKGSRFEVLGEDDDVTTKGNQGQVCKNTEVLADISNVKATSKVNSKKNVKAMRGGIKIQTINNNTTHKKAAVNSNSSVLDVGHMKISAKDKQKGNPAREVAVTIDMEAKDEIGVLQQLHLDVLSAMDTSNKLLEDNLTSVDKGDDENI
ncbi:hypothetical protein ACOSQ4_006907 [Xanthoceras sorbifolium]